MPTYTTYASSGTLSPEQKHKIAKEVTRIHYELTDAQTFFAQVMFVDVPDGNWYTGGAIRDEKQIFVHGQIRGGRSLETKQAMINQIVDAVSGVTSLPRNLIWVYILELEPLLMAEYGHILPKPGNEDAWFAELPPEDRALMESVGARSS